MIFNKKSIPLVYCACTLPLFTPMLLNAQETSTQCGILQLQVHRTLGTAITENKCAATPGLSLGSEIELQTGTRAWLESEAKAGDAQDFQIVCLNKSPAPQKLKIVSPHLPWLAPLNVHDCGPWLANRLVCRYPDNRQEILLCAIAPKRATTVNVVRPRTSVPVRGFGGHLKPQPANEQQTFTQLAAPGINLCRQLLNTNQGITLSCTLAADGTVTRASVAGPGIDQQFAACALDAVNHLKLPAPAHETALKLSF